ncbi:MAG TPA: hypothetical protein DIU16_01715 [Candidatus Vogelbacteria bacterium]|nr:hypothetical protein [Candidatus Vogelbacteria bacterium]
MKRSSLELVDCLLLIADDKEVGFIVEAPEKLQYCILRLVRILVLVRQDVLVLLLQSEEELAFSHEHAHQLHNHVSIIIESLALKRLFIGAVDQRELSVALIFFRIRRAVYCAQECGKGGGRHILALERLYRLDDGAYVVQGIAKWFDGLQAPREHRALHQAQ